AGDPEADGVEAAVPLEGAEPAAEVLVLVPVVGRAEEVAGGVAVAEAEALDPGGIEVADGAAGVAPRGELPPALERGQREGVELPVLRAVPGAVDVVAADGATLLDGAVEEAEGLEVLRQRGGGGEVPVVPLGLGLERVHIHRAGGVEEGVEGAVDGGGQRGVTEDGPCGLGRDREGAEGFLVEPLDLDGPALVLGGDEERLRPTHVLLLDGDTSGPKLRHEAGDVALGAAEDLGGRALGQAGIVVELTAESARGAGELGGGHRIRSIVDPEKVNLARHTDTFDLDSRLLPGRRTSQTPSTCSA